jgi:hypothetical protein
MLSRIAHIAGKLSAGIARIRPSFLTIRLEVSNSDQLLLLA